MAAAGATSTLRVDSGFCLIVERDPIITAKEAASVDHLSGGRFEFGVGASWNREEMRKRSASLRRLANIAVNPRVAVVVNHYEDDWHALWWVRAGSSPPTSPRGATPSRDWWRAIRSTVISHQVVRW